MKNESIVAIVACVVIVGIVALGLVAILAVFCYKQENINLLGRHKSEADIKGKVRSETEWKYDSTKKGNSENSSKKENNR